MNTYAVSSNNLEKAIEKAKEISVKENVGKFDLTILEFEKALGIEDVRNFQKNLFLKPFKSEKKSLILVLKNQATTEAQNSMLKILEEPPASTLIFLITNNIHGFLPTILSRVKIIELTREEKGSESFELDKVLGLGNVGERLRLAQIVSKDKGEAVKWLESVILSARGEMIDTAKNPQESLKYRKLIHKLEISHYDLKNTNTNARLSLEKTFLEL